MNLAAVMDEMKTVLDGMTGDLRCFAYPPPTVVAPAGIISYPDRVDYDQTYGRGMDRIRGIPIVLLVGKATDRTARDRVAVYAAGSGTDSVKAAFEAHAWAACDDVIVTACSFDVVTVASVDYIAATFEADAVGRGA